LQFDSADMSAIVATHPRREDAEQNIQDQLIVEYYSR
jgi:ribosomal protein S4